MQRQEQDAVVGTVVVGSGEERIGRVEAVFADYLLVRTLTVIPVDLYVPRLELSAHDDEARTLTVACSPAEAYARWHRPLRRAPHD